MKPRFGDLQRALQSGAIRLFTRSRFARFAIRSALPPVNLIPFKYRRRSMSGHMDGHVLSSDSNRPWRQWCAAARTSSRSNEQPATRSACWSRFHNLKPWPGSAAPRPSPYPSGAPPAGLDVLCLDKARKFEEIFIPHVSIEDITYNCCYTLRGVVGVNGRAVTDAASAGQCGPCIFQVGH